MPRQNSPYCEEWHQRLAPTEYDIKVQNCENGTMEFLIVNQGKQTTEATLRSTGSTTGIVYMDTQWLKLRRGCRNWKEEEEKRRRCCEKSVLIGLTESQYKKNDEDGHFYDIYFMHAKHILDEKYINQANDWFGHVIVRNGWKMNTAYKYSGPVLAYLHLTQEEAVRQLKHFINKRTMTTSYFLENSDQDFSNYVGVIVPAGVYG